MRKRNGASLLNVMVFMVFAVMVTAQVFFFSQSSMESLADEREIMMYRLNLDSLLEEAKTALMEQGNIKEIVHDNALHDNNNSMTYSQFFDGLVEDGKQVFTQARFKNGLKWEMSSEWDSNKYYAAIHDLDYVFDSRFSRGTYINGDGDKSGYGNENAYKKVFAAMPSVKEKVPDGEGNLVDTDEVLARYYLIRVYAKLSEKFYGRHLMYQVLVKRDENDHTKLDTLSFQEVWF